MPFQKELKFQYSGLPKDFYLIFTFDDQTIQGHTMYQNLFPIVWKVAHLQPHGDYQFSEFYYQQLAFTTAESEAGIVKTTSAVIDIELKQESVLTGDRISGFQWTTPQTGSGIADDQFAAKNDTGSLQQIAVCVHPRGQFAQPLLYLEAPAGGTVLAQLTPRLRMYVVSDMQEGTIIKAQVSGKVLFDRLLTDPSVPTSYNITYDPPSGNLVIKPA